MEKLKDALKKSLREAGAEEIVEKATAINMWPKIVGKEINKVTEATHIDKGVLFVKTATPVWRNELMFKKKEIKDKINNKLSKTTIKDIRFI
tara:strand:+ start:706 stop:981 length:276 start_codon:yes stop_codon:yes gene_type:complete